uniref:Histone acetyltransferase n=1 Tax=Caenorhabditis tropicalis TaxID=1561998 RepID=A0A1I7UL45_9PELO
MGKVTTDSTSNSMPPTISNGNSKSRPQNGFENTPKRKLFRRAGDDPSSNSEPLSKKMRAEANDMPRGKNSEDNKTPTTETSEEDTTRRRRTLKPGGASPTCTFCKDVQESEQLLECSTCKANYHIKKCLRYKDEIADNIMKLKEWFCPRCVVCSACNDFVSDALNVECSACCRAWHGACAPKGHSPSVEFDSPWFCSACCRTRNFRVIDSPGYTPSRKSVPTGRKCRKSNDKLEFNIDIDELTDLINKRDFTWEYLNYEAGFTSAPPIPPPQPKSRLKGSKSLANNQSEYNQVDRNASIPKVVAKDVKLFHESEKRAYPQKETSSAQNGQFLHFGTGKSCKAIYSSAYQEPLHSAPHLYACKFCLHTTHLKEDLVVHWDHCTSRHPPGNEIYRDDGISFFEVDGAYQKKYCQDLCLLAKLFIASKTLYDEVETFIFYVLCEITSEGYVIVGYFSKEKNPSKNNNLSCLLVLPMVQKMGYGRLLIDMSYELSRREHRVGHPEHPLSDLGILAYRGYWRSSLLCYIRSHRNSDRLSIKDICLATRITPVDIVNQMMIDKLITLKGTVYSIKVSKRALKFPLSQCRRRVVNPSKLVWKPRNTAGLDPTKINSYI